MYEERFSSKAMLVGFSGETSLLLENSEVQAIDPLGLDSHLPNIIGFNTTDDVSGLSQAVNYFTPEFSIVDSYDVPHALAALRDLGFLVANLGRLDPELQSVNTQTISVLERLGHKLEMPPRDTLYTYSVWNPCGDRQRSFTGTGEEEIFINSIRNWHNHLHSAFSSLFQMREHELVLDASEVSGLSSSFKQMVDNMVAVRRGMSSRWFYEHLQPYFAPLNIGDVEYEPPSGSHMNLLLMDYVLWGSDSDNPLYRNYLDHNILYLLPFYRAKIAGSLEESIYSILSRQSGEVDGQIAASKAALLDITNAIISFRRVHLTMAREMLTAKYPAGIPEDNIELRRLAQLLDGVDQIRQLILKNR